MEIAELRQRLQHLERKREGEHEREFESSQWQSEKRESEMGSRVVSGKGESAASRSGVKKMGKIYSKVERADSKHSSELEQAEVGCGSAPRPRFSSARTDFFS